MYGTIVWPDLRVACRVGSWPRPTVAFSCASDRATASGPRPSSSSRTRYPRSATARRSCAPSGSRSTRPTAPGSTTRRPTSLRWASARSCAGSAWAEPAHDLADAHRREVGRRVVDPGAVGRVERDPLGAHERLAVADRGYLVLDELEGLGPDAVARSLAQEKATVGLGHDPTLQATRRSGQTIVPYIQPCAVSYTHLR